MHKKINSDEGKGKSKITTYARKLIADTLKSYALSINLIFWWKAQRTYKIDNLLVIKCLNVFFQFDSKNT